MKRLLRGEGGFTLIELLAVMAIVATLAGIVSTSVSGTNETSKTAAAKQDASTTVSAAGAYFADQEAAEVLTPSTVTVTALFDGEVVADIPTEQKISTRWPETYITEEFDSKQVIGAATATPYTNEFPTLNAAANTITVHVSILGKADSDDVRIPITRKELLEGYTAIDFDRLVGDGTEDNPGGYSEKAPSSAVSTTEALDLDFHNFLWLFRKTTSAGGSGKNDSRVISVFKLERIDTTNATTGENASPASVDLTFVQIY
ncbi:MAG: prepilin-type N-terminal cleavage/methylation domain-containing protein [Chloroflexi bacterium]|nr:prepilin-type N-terminal cleavage/methylation domain-containing protein [Chloroflexota bacterium]